MNKLTDKPPQWAIDLAKRLLDVRNIFTAEVNDAALAIAQAVEERTGRLEHKVEQYAELVCDKYGAIIDHWNRIQRKKAELNGREGELATLRSRLERAEADTRRLEFMLDVEESSRCIDTNGDGRFRVAVVAAGVGEGQWRDSARDAIDAAMKEKTK